MDQQTFECTLTDALKPMVGMTIGQELLNTLRATIPNIIARGILGMDQYENDTRVFAKKPMNFSRTKWYIADVNHNDYPDALDWCREQFGQRIKRPDAWSRWKADRCTFWFRDEKDYNWFTLRWGA